MGDFKNELRVRNGVRFSLDGDGNLHMVGASPVCTFDEASLAQLASFLDEGIPVMRERAAQEAAVQAMNARHRLGIPEPVPEPEPGPAPAPLEHVEIQDEVTKAPRSRRG